MAWKKEKIEEIYCLNMLENFQIMNTFFKKKDGRRLTWRSPKGLRINEIDFTICNKMYCQIQVSLIQ